MVKKNIFKKNGIVVLVIIISSFLFPLGVFAQSQKNITPYYGKYQIYEIRNLGGSITPDSEAARWLGSFIGIHSHEFSIRNTKIVKPKYGIENIRLEKKEGNVNPEDLSIFWGIEADRSYITRILVFEGALERYPYEKIEVIDKDNLLEIFDGRIYFIRRVSENSTPEKKK